MRYRGLLGLALCLAAFAGPAEAALSLRYQTDLHGDMLVIGNTLGFDCRAGLPDPKVGTFDRSMCYANAAFNLPVYIDDSSDDVFWRSEDNGQVTASSSITIAQARSAALLQLPAGATVAYARIYWSSTVVEDNTSVSSILIDRPGAGSLSRQIDAAPQDIQAADRSFQATADITDLVQAGGSGIYRVTGAGGFPKSNMVDHADPNNYAAWSIVVFYKRDTDPVRNLVVYDGLTFVSQTNSSSLNLRGFVVPQQGAGDSKLAIIGYEGDSDEVGDAILWKGMRLTDGQSGSDNNLMNGSHTAFAQPVSVAGDLPQLTGEAGSMMGLDLDVISLANGQLSPGDNQAQLDLVTGTTINSDQYFVGAVATSIVSRKPVIEAILTVPQSISPLPGDTVEYTLTIKNIGDDGASNVVVEQTLPAGLSYVPGTLSIASGPNQGNKTDAIGDDQAEYDSATRTLRIRVGTGASGTQGGDIPAAGTPTVVKFQLQVADTAFGTVATQAILTATPTSTPSVGPSTYFSSDGTQPNHPTVITVRQCMNNYDCTVTAPVCDMRSSPHRCTASCTGDADCVGAPGGQDVCGTASQCAQCSPTQSAACTANGFGSVCLPTGACGCNNNADCGGRTCDTTTNKCPKPSADLSAEITSSPDPADVEHPITLTIKVTNKGPALAPSGTQILIQIPTGFTVQSVTGSQGWRCTQVSNNVRCIDYRPIAANGSSPEIKIVVAAPMGTDPGPTLAVQATVTSDSSVDPVTSDNTVTSNIAVGRYRVAGGGIGCSLADQTNSASLYSAATVALLALFALRRRRSYSNSKELTRAANA